MSVSLAGSLLRGAPFTAGAVCVAPVRKSIGAHGGAAGGASKRGRLGVRILLPPPVKTARIAGTAVGALRMSPQLSSAPLGLVGLWGGCHVSLDIRPLSTSAGSGAVPSGGVSAGAASLLNSAAPLRVFVTHAAARAGAAHALLFAGRLLIAATPGWTSRCSPSSAALLAFLVAFSSGQHAAEKEKRLKENGASHGEAAAEARPGVVPTGWGGARGGGGGGGAQVVARCRQRRLGVPAPLSRLVGHRATRPRRPRGSTVTSVLVRARRGRSLSTPQSAPRRRAASRALLLVRLTMRKSFFLPSFYRCLSHCESLVL